MPSSIRERGAALVIVMVVILGVLALLGFLLPTSQIAVAAQFEDERMQLAQLVLQSGVNDALYEVSAGGRDLDELRGTPDGRGPLGAVTALPTPGSSEDPGVPVTDASGRVLGRYMAVFVQETSKLGTLHVVAGVPDLKRYDTSTARGKRQESERVMLAAQIRLEIFVWNPFGDRNALAFAGPVAGTSGAGGGNIGFQGNLGANNRLRLRVEGYDPDPDDGVPETRYVPAVNISDPAWHAAFLQGVVYDNQLPLLVESGLAVSRADLRGGRADPPDYTSNSYRFDDTVGQQPSKTQMINDETLRILTEAWRAPGTNSPNQTWTSSGNYTAANELVHLNGNVTFSGSGQGISGSGTLVLNGRVEFKNGAKLNWEGDVIIAPSGNAKGGITFNGGDSKIAGNLVIASNPSGGSSAEANLYLTNGANLDVRGQPGLDGQEHGGGILVLQSGVSTANFQISKGSRLDVDGLFGILGNNVDFEVVGSTSDGKSYLNVDGSLVIGVPAESSSGIQRFLIGNEAEADLTFKNPAFTSGVKSITSGPRLGLEGFNPPPEVYTSAYLETQVTGYDEAHPFWAAFEAGIGGGGVQGIPGMN